ncbi:MAG: T9SS type A sorting domain-containing protein [Flavobacteriales bacterium]
MSTCTAMLRISALLLIGIGSVPIAHPQNCLPQGITFNLQSEVDAFPTTYPGCAQIDGFLRIGPSNDGFGGGITDLTPLSQITSVGGYLLVEFTIGLGSLDGLDNLASVGGYLKLNVNDNLSDITALSNLTTVGGLLEVRQNPVLTSLEGLASVSTTGGNVRVQFNDGLTDLQGLEGLVDVGGAVSVEGNSSLQSMNGLAPQSVGAGFWVKNNPQLMDLSAASGLTSIGGFLNVQDNASLPSLEDLASVTALGGYLRVQNCPLITDLTPLANIDPASIGQLLLQDLPGVSDCALANICAYLALPDAQPTIANNASGCASVAEVEAACSTTSITDPTVASAMALQLFPNPSNGIVQLQAAVQGPVLLRVYDPAGRAVHSERSSAGAGCVHTLHLAHLLPGCYLLQVQSDQDIATERLIIE